MKSRKFKAVLAAVSAIAVLATAMTGFAATITTVTQYNIDNPNKASVTTTVEGLTDKDAEVTLLVSAPGAGVNGSGISYIDQKAASDGTAEFTYQLDKAALSDATAAVVTSGNDAGEAVTGDDRLGVTPVSDVTSDEKYEILYNQDYVGTGDANVTAVINAKAGYEITAITWTGAEGNQYDAGKTSYTIPRAAISSVAVTAQAVVTAPAVTDVTMNATQNAAGKYENTVVMKLLNSQPTIGVGVIYDDVFYPAMNGVSVGGTFAVQLIADSDITKAITTFVE